MPFNAVNLALSMMNALSFPTALVISGSTTLLRLGKPADIAEESIDSQAQLSAAELVRFSQRRAGKASRARRPAETPRRSPRSSGARSSGRVHLGLLRIVLILRQQRPGA